MNSIHLHTDGGSRGNPGPAALGVVIGPPINKGYSKYLGKATNNEAEYQAVIFALEKLRSLIGRKEAKRASVDVFMDSKLAAEQLSGRWRIEGKNIVPLFVRVHNLRFDFGKVNFHYVPREQNKDADKLVNQELDRRAGGDSLFNL